MAVSIAPTFPVPMQHRTVHSTNCFTSQYYILAQLNPHAFLLFFWASAQFSTNQRQLLRTPDEI